MSKLESIIKGLGSKQMGRITVLDSGYIEDGTDEGQAVESLRDLLAGLDEPVGE